MDDLIGFQSVECHDMTCQMESAVRFAPVLKTSRLDIEKLACYVFLARFAASMPEKYKAFAGISNEQLEAFLSSMFPFVLRERITLIASETRQSLGSDSKGQCYRWSHAVAEALQLNKIKAVVAAGIFSWQTGNSAHFWVESMGYVVDITADQFNEEAKLDLPTVVVLPIRQARHWTERTFFEHAITPNDNQEETA